MLQKILIHLTLVVIAGFSLATSDVYSQLGDVQNTDRDEEKTGVQEIGIEQLPQIENSASETVVNDASLTDDSPSSGNLVDLDSGYQVKTVYVDARWGSRTVGSAKTLSKSHKKYTSMGYRFVDLELYLENSDLRGFFVTYERDSKNSD